MKKHMAIEAMDQMLEPIAGQLAVAVEIEASMEVLNEEVHARQRPAIYGAEAFRVIQQAYVSELALALAKLYETPVPRNGATKAQAFNKTDLASIPLLLRLLQQDRCKAVLCDRNRSWDRDGTEVQWLIDDASRIWCRMRRSSAIRDALTRVTDYRHFAVHLLRRGPPARLPTYREVFVLVDNAVAIMRLIQPAMTGTNRNLSVFEELWRDEARDFWSRALPATIIPEDDPKPPPRGLSPPQAV